MAVDSFDHWWKSSGPVRMVTTSSSDGVGLDLHSQLPDEGGQLTGDGDLDLVVMHEAPLQGLEAGVKAVLGAPGNLFDPTRLAFLPLCHGMADARLYAVVGGAFDEDPPGVGIPAFGDAGLILFSSR